MKKLFLVIFCVLSIQCEKQNQSSPIIKYISPAVDYSTPDKLIRSIWTFQIWQDTTYDRDTSEFKFYTSGVKMKLWDKYRKGKDELRSDNFRMQNVINKVSIESDSRAIVETKEKGYRNQKGFSEVKYILAKENNNWRVEDVLEICWNCKGEGKETDYSSLYSHIKTTCKYCDGLGWTSQLFPKPIEVK